MQIFIKPKQKFSTSPSFCENFKMLNKTHLYFTFTWLVSTLFKIFFLNTHSLYETSFFKFNTFWFVCCVLNHLALLVKRWIVLYIHWINHYPAEWICHYWKQLRYQSFEQLDLDNLYSHDHRPCSQIRGKINPSCFSHSPQFLELFFIYLFFYFISFALKNIEKKIKL